MVVKKKVKIEKVCPYAYQQCVIKGICHVCDLEYGQRQRAANVCESRRDKVDKDGWINKYKMVAAKVE